MQVEVKNIKGENTGRSIELPADIFGIEPNEHAVYLAVKQYLAHQRQGTHKTKERSEASGSTRKLHKQKGTGGSRKGDINSVVLGGSRTFGPKPHDYVVKLNKKVRQLARKSVLSAKAAAGSITVVEDFSFEAPKTKEFVGVLTNLGVKGTKSLIVLPELNENVLKSSRNVERTSVARANDLNTYQIVNTQSLVLTESAVAKIQETFA
ncbi:MAG: 50S ribosomal protein L4 [Saprospiraceae bacterium]|nr:50S ribosomal protein L4 [Saprospiraceae bacterium]